MKRHLFWIAELIIWVLILFLVSGGLMLAKYNYKKNFNTYQIFLPDVDGLIDGSPVKLMGIQIGYVNQIDIVGEDVYVKFIITESKVKIPRGATATVEFSGLGGSKSLEIYPPKPGQGESEKLLIPQSPKRIHDSLGLLNKMFDNVIEITYEFSHFMDEMGITKSRKDKADFKSATEILKDSNDWLDEAQRKTEEIADKLNKDKTKKEEKDE